MASSLRSVLRRGAAVILLGVAAFAVYWPSGLASDGRLALFAFLGAAIGWILTRIEPAWIALTAALFLVLSGAADSDTLFSALGSDIVWLIIGAFMLGAAIQETGLASRFTTALMPGSTRVDQLMWRLNIGLIPLALVLPSTSGRAAVVRPLYDSLAEAADDRRIARAFGLLFPAVITISTVASLIGAGSHLVADHMLGRIAGEHIGFGSWLIWGLPLGIAASLLATGVIAYLYLDGEQRARRLTPATEALGPLSSAEWRTLAIAGVMIALWLSESWQPLGVALVAVLGAAALTSPGLGPIDWKTGIHAVSWNLVVFVAAALMLGHALLDSGAAPWIVDRLMAVSGLQEGRATLVILAALILIGVTSHLYMISHTARAAALLPPLLAIAGRLDLDATAVVFITSLAMDYCLTLPVSSKAILVFYDDDAPWNAADLIGLSAVLAPLFSLLMVGFYYGYWQFVGLAL
ncbi:SLC13 family permease [Salinisphaera sp. SPP-AMP-43]|uniref:SLC13 family permease n=1 Tax=Salinisphaera sp. SPP-AMP-43 TaxID=3121288 RepID=UPI003C6DE9FB